MRYAFTTSLLVCSLLMSQPANSGEFLEWFDNIPKPEINIYSSCSAHSKIPYSHPNAGTIDEIGYLLYMEYGFNHSPLFDRLFSLLENEVVEDVLHTCDINHERIASFDFLGLPFAEEYREASLRVNDSICYFDLAYAYHLLGDPSYLEEIEKSYPHCRAIRRSLEDTALTDQMFDVVIQAACIDALNYHDCIENEVGAMKEFDYNEKKEYLLTNSYSRCIYNEISPKIFKYAVTESSIVFMLQRQFERKYDISLQCSLQNFN